MLIAQHLRIAEGDHFVHLNCGNGLSGAVAASLGAERITLTDRNIVSVEASARTTKLNDIDRSQVFHSHGLAGAHDVLVNINDADVVAIRLPHDRLSQLQLLVDAFRLLREGGICYVSGATNEGVKPAIRTMKKLFGATVMLAQKDGHHLVRAVKRGPEPLDPGLLQNTMLDAGSFSESLIEVRGQSVVSVGRPGVFSWQHADEATNLLAKHMRVGGEGSLLDIGCGSGIVGTIASRISGQPLCMLDADSEAVRCAEMTARKAGLNKARIVASDVTSAVTNEIFTTVLSNPPFHIGKATNLVVPEQFILEAFEVLEPGGDLQIVANRTLPYESMLQAVFGNYVVLHDGQRFKVLQAVKKDLE